MINFIKQHPYISMAIIGFIIIQIGHYALNLIGYMTPEDYELISFGKTTALIALTTTKVSFVLFLIDLMSSNDYDYVNEERTPLERFLN